MRKQNQLAGQGWGLAIEKWSQYLKVCLDLDKSIVGQQNTFRVFSATCSI